VELLFRPDEPLDFLDQGGGGHFDGFNDAFGLLLHGHRLVTLVLLDQRRRLKVRFAKLFLVVFAGCFGGRCALRRQAGGDVFSALDFVTVPPLKHALRSDGLARGLGTRLGGLAVRFLLTVAQAAARTEATPASSPGKISLTHV